VRLIHDDAGSIALTTIALLPLLLIALAGVLQLGARVRAAADLATLVAVNDQDLDELARTGTLRLASDAADVARDYFERNLELSAPLLASAAADVARAADVAVYPSAPATDARTGTRYERPSVRIAASVPLRTPVLGALVFQPVTSVSVLAVSSPR
jgi:hypothetical protein